MKRRTKQAKHFATREQAAILLASNVGNSVPQIAAMWMTDEHHVRRVIHEFNERRMASLDPEYRGGRPRRITDADRRGVVAVAGARPDSQGVPLTRWSLPCLADHLAEQGVVQISAAHLGRVLAEAGAGFRGPPGLLPRFGMPIMKWGDAGVSRRHAGALYWQRETNRPRVELPHHATVVIVAAATPTDQTEPG